MKIFHPELHTGIRRASARQNASILKRTIFKSSKVCIKWSKMMTDDLPDDNLESNIEYSTKMIENDHNSHGYAWLISYLWCKLYPPSVFWLIGSSFSLRNIFININYKLGLCQWQTSWHFIWSLVWHEMAFSTTILTISHKLIGIHHMCATWTFIKHNATE